jgi:hypothetical protein
MGYVKEPEGADFIINSRPLAKKEELAISEYIKTCKAKHAVKKKQQLKIDDIENLPEKKLLYNSLLKFSFFVNLIFPLPAQRLNFHCHLHLQIAQQKNNYL